MGDVQQVSAKVQRYLTDSFTGVTLEKQGFSIRHGSARAFIELTSPGDDAPTFVVITVPLLFGVNDGPALHEHIAFHADDYHFGHLSLRRRTESGDVDIFLTHTLLGDYLDEQELGRAVGASLQIANDLDDELQAQFGGQRFHEA